MNDPPAVSQAHVLPVDDVFEHEASEDCICGPDVEFVKGGAIFTHHYLKKDEEREHE